MPESEYVTALCEDIYQEAQSLGGDDRRKLHSIFIGGGTPSLFSANAIGKILNTADKALGFDPAIEITLEANPGAAEAQRFRDYRSAGINRLSIGIQSFQNDKLSALGRVHNGDEAKAAIDSCGEAGIENFNLDLMHGLPGQKLNDALNDLAKAIACNPTHLSWYQLTIEPNTEFHSRPPSLPEENTISEIQDQGMDKLEGAGYSRYEVSAFARTDCESRHNLNYWEFGDYLGVGAGAHGKRTLSESARIIRNRKQKQPSTYIAAEINRTAEHREVPTQELPFEFLMNALRIKKGFTIEAFENRTGVTFSHIRKRVEYLTSQGLLVFDGNKITTTGHGFRVLNSLLEEFLDNDCG